VNCRGPIYQGSFHYGVGCRTPIAAEAPMEERQELMEMAHEVWRFIPPPCVGPACH